MRLLPYTSRRAEQQCTAMEQGAACNRKYTPYSSTTMDTSVGQPDGISLACLSCHDGTIAVDSIANAPGSGTNLTGPWYGISASTEHYALAQLGNRRAVEQAHVCYVIDRVGFLSNPNVWFDAMAPYSKP